MSPRAVKIPRQQLGRCALSRFSSRQFSNALYADYASHPRLIWPDGVSYAPDGYMFVSAAQVSEAAGFNGGQQRNTAPCYIFRFPPLAPGRLGH